MLSFNIDKSSTDAKSKDHNKVPHAAIVNFAKRAQSLAKALVDDIKILRLFLENVSVVFNVSLIHDESCEHADIKARVTFIISVPSV